MKTRLGATAPQTEADLSRAKLGRLTATPKVVTFPENHRTLNNSVDGLETTLGRDFA
jgi:hypothetical protein